MVLEIRQTLKVLLVIFALALLFIQVASASSNCPNCTVRYDVESVTTGSHAASDTLYPLVLLNPSSGNFMHSDQVNLASVVLTLV